MNDALAVAMIVAIPPTIAAIGALIQSVRNGGKIGKVRDQLNGRLEELLEVTRKAYFSAGVKQEAEREKTISPPTGPETLGNSALRATTSQP